MPTCNVTGTLRNAEGVALPNTPVSFLRGGVYAQAGSVILERLPTTVSDAFGEISINLLPGVYLGIALDHKGTRDGFEVGVPDAPTADLADIIDQAVEVTPTVLAAAIAARDAAIEAADRVDLGALDDAVAATAADRLQTGADAVAASVSADISQAWAESPTPPGDAGTKSAKTWAEESEAFRDQAFTAYQGRQYPTRADFVTDVTVNGYSPAVGTVVTAGGVSYARTEGATAIPDLAGWLPLGEVTPQHFGAAGDGVADDTAAINAAINYGWLVYIKEGTYIISGAGIFARNGGRVYGAGRTKTILKKKANVGETDELDPIFRERVEASVFLPIRDVTIEHIGFEGNGNSEIKTNKGAGLFRCYESYNVRIRGCSFYRARGYAIGLQGADASPDPQRRGPHVDTIIEDCDIYENGKAEYLLGTDADDGVDFKSSLRATLKNCRAWDNGDKGFDLRGRDLTVIGCYSWENAGAGFTHGVEGIQSGGTEVAPSVATFTNCWAWANGLNGFVATPQVTLGVTTAVQITTFANCTAWDNTHNFAVASQGANDLSQLYLNLEGCNSYNPRTGTRHFLASAPSELVSINGGLYLGGSTTGISINGNHEGVLNICGATMEGIAGTAITGATNGICTSNISGNTFRNIGSAVFSGHSNTTISGNTYANITPTARFSFTGTNNRVLDKEQGVRSVSSAATMTLPEITDIFAIVGTTNITNITASWAGRIVTLRFTTVLDVVDGGNLRLAGNLTTANNTMLTLICDGATWYETARSVN